MLVYLLLQHEQANCMAPFATQKVGCLADFVTELVHLALQD